MAGYGLPVREPASKGRTDTASLEMTASPEAIYAAFADPDSLMEWIPPGTMTGRALEYDFRQGGRYRIELTYAEDSPTAKTTGRTDMSAGRFLSLEPPRRIVWSVEFESTDDAFAGEMIMTWSFNPTANGTRVTVTVENVPAGISQSNHDEGLRSSLENLAKHVI